MPYGSDYRYEKAHIDGEWATATEAYLAACREGADPTKNMIFN